MKPRKIILENDQSPGDVIMLTAAVRDLHAAHPHKFLTKIKTSSPDLWKHNPLISDFPDEEADQVIHCDYPLVHSSGRGAYHFIHGFRKDLEKKLDIIIPQGAFKGDIYLSREEKSWMSQLEERGVGKPFWIIVAGGKLDFTANLINLVGQTDIRQFVRLMYHAVGVLCPVTFAMHLSAATECKNGALNRPTVVVAGGREPAHWEAYPHHRYLSNNGALTCCADGGCWKSRCTLVHDGDKKDKTSVCIFPIETGQHIIFNSTNVDTKEKTTRESTMRIARCLDMIKPRHVIEAIESYYEGGMLSYE
jgi:hypothetical protein